MDLSELPNSSLLSQNQWNHKYKLKCIKVISVTNVITKNVIYSYQILGGAGGNGGLYELNPHLMLEANR